MRITAIELENFKGISDRVRVELKPITLLFGANSAGKSTILHALLYLHDLIGKGHAHAGELTLSPGHDLGGFKNVVHRNDTKREIVLRLELDLDGAYLDMPEYLPGYADMDFDWGSPSSARPEAESLVLRLAQDINAQMSSAAIEITVAWSEGYRLAWVRCYSVEINGNLFGRMQAAVDASEAAITHINFEHPLLQSSEHEQWLDDFGRHYPPEEGNSRTEFEEKLRDMVSGGSEYAGKRDITLAVLTKHSALPEVGAFLRLGLVDRCGEAALNEEIVRNMFIGMLSQAFVCPLEMALREISGLRYLGPLRTIPPRDFEPSSLQDPARWSDGMAAWEVLLKSDDSLINEVNDWMAKPDKLASGCGIERTSVREVSATHINWLLQQEDPSASVDWWGVMAELVKTPEHQRISLIDTNSNTRLQPLDVGVGISQVLPVVVAALEPSASLVCIEQPELHIHPAIQVGLGDLFIEGALKKGTQFLIETHSEHLILRLLRRVRETTDGDLPPGLPEVKPEHIGVLYVDNSEGGMRITQLPIDETGEFTVRWPKGFFVERGEELF